MVGMTPRRRGPDNGRVAERAASARSAAAASRLAPARDDVLAHRGEPHVALVALDELHAQQPLELLDPGGQRGLGHELRFRGGPEVQALGELDQVGELAQGGEGGHQARPWSIETLDHCNQYKSLDRSRRIGHEWRVTSRASGPERKASDASLPRERERNPP